VITVGRENIVCQLMHLRLGLLNTNDIGMLCPHPFEKSLAGSGTNAVGVQAYNAKQL
jgi:hypothetical protein